MHKIVIVGGGAGGLELAAMLSKKIHKNQIDLTLIDASLKHVWKPLLHEVATGTLDSHEEELDFIPYANKHGFRFVYGRLQRIDRNTRELFIAPVRAEAGDDLIPERIITYDYLVMATGSLSNDFHIPGVQAHCLFLDTLQDAEAVQKILINKIIQQIQHHNDDGPTLDIAIVGAGATGVELAAEIDYALKQSKQGQLDAPLSYTNIKLIEGRDRITPQMTARVSEELNKWLRALGIEIFVNEQVASVTSDAIHTISGKIIPADLKIWAAGIKGDDMLKMMDGLEVNAINQLLVTKTLQTTLDKSIFAMGDCACCPQNNHTGKIVPPTAQAAHQQACLLAKSLIRIIKGKPLLEFRYREYGALITVSHSRVVGYIVSQFPSSLLHIDGTIAQWLYKSVHKKHQIALHGYWRTFLMSLANFLTRKNRTRLKLH